MRASRTDRNIRRIRNALWCYHVDDDIADRAYNLLGDLLERRRKERRDNPPVDRLGNTHADRACMAQNGLCPADFM